MLGVPGLPQSGTGQTAIMTGLNAPSVAGAHQGPYPTARMQALLGAHGLPAVVQAAGLRLAFANAYPDAFLARLAAGGGRLDAVARSMALAGVRMRGEDALRRGTAISASITGHGWRAHLGIDVPLVAEADAGARLAALAARHDLTVFAHYATDVAGHRGTLDSAVRTLGRYDAFLSGLLAALPAGIAVVLVSDHGNIEDLSHGRHTTNPAMAAWRGAAAPARWSATTDVAPAIRAALGLAMVPAVDGTMALH